jgi:uncharacterized protein YfaS (alpha-2-macroglobulin family)
LIMKRNRLICLVLIYAIVGSSSIRLAPAQTSDSQKIEEKEGLQFRLREGGGKTSKNEALPPAPPVKLSAAENDAIFRRLPPINTDISDQTDFAQRPESLPPPKTGKVIPVKFPADTQPEAPAENSAALEVVRFAPNGFVPLAADLSVTFSQPMIAVSSQTAAAQTVPVKLFPEVKGNWRWLGTKTLIFDAKERFPMATKFVAVIPAGTRSATGASLQKEFVWNFETPPPKVESFIPNRETVRRDSILLANFNQEIIAEDVLPKISLVSNGQKFALRLADQSEISADQILSEKIKKLLPKHWLAFRAVELLPVDAQIDLTFEAGTPSAEGNLTSVLPQNFAFKTFGSLKFEKSFCGYDQRAKECASYEDLQIGFNNPIDEKSFDKSLVKIEPEIEDAKIAIYGSEIEISGDKTTRTTYKITVAGSLKDKFGQILGKAITTEFKISAESPGLSSDAENRDFLTLDPSARRRFSVYSTNLPGLKVKIYAVKPEDYPAFYNYTQDEKENLPQIGNLVFDKTIKIKSKPDMTTETKIDLAPALPNGLGHAILVVEPLAGGIQIDSENIVVWLEATQLGVDAFADYEQLNVYASDLKTGKPLKNVSLRLSNKTENTRLTDENGLAKFELPEAQKGNKWLIAQNGADSAILFGNDDDERVWSNKIAAESLRWFVFDDRKIYRPGETVSIKGYLRRIAAGKLADIGELGDAAKRLKYVLKDSLGNDIYSGNADLNMFGAFDFQLKLPENINLGNEKLELSVESPLENKETAHYFQVEEFRRPEFEVSARSETVAPFYVGDSATVSVEAKYYAGGFLANAETDWTVTSKPTNFTPPNRDDFTFGKFIPWWRDYYESDYANRTTENFKGRADASGKHFLAMDFISANPSRPFTIEAEARVQDVNRQTFAGSTTLLVHPSELYVGLRTPKTFVGKGEQFKVETITTDIDGKAVADAPVSILAELKDWQQIKGEWQEVTVDTQTCRIKSASAIVSCDFNAKQGGVFTIKASVLDRKERRNESELNVWVAGGNIEPSLDVEKESVELIPDKKDYAPNDTAEILVNTPFFPAEGVLTLRRNGIVKTERFTMNESSTVLRIPIEERFLPNVHVQIDLFGAEKRIIFEDETDAKLPKRPAFAGGELDLGISTDSRKLNVAAEPVEKILEPGGATTINVAVTDDDGNPSTNTEVAVIAVDESILALTNYRISNPLDVFYQSLEPAANDYYSRENILLANPEDLITPENGFGFGRGNRNGSGSGGGNGEGSSSVKPGPATVFRKIEVITRLERSASMKSTRPDQIRIRQNFDPLAIFSPSVRTDASGKASVKINLPDNLTRYRITAVAATNSKKFGMTESAITARQQLMVRPSAPRFMNFGDRAELPVVLQNQTDTPLTIDVAIRTTNADLPDGNGQKITVPANDRAEIRFPVSTKSAGIARFQIGATSGNLADAAEFAFPVYKPATSEAFATYGTTDQNGAIVQSIETPTDVFPGFGELEITTGSTQLQELTDAFIYLQSYPFECSEQISSRILSVAALRDVLQAFKTKDLPTKEQINAKMNSDIERLQKLQHGDGGFSFWRSDDESLPFITVHVAHALARASQKGYQVPMVVSRNLLNYLKNIEAKLPETYSLEARWAISAYALYVRDLLGDKDAGKARKLLQTATLEALSPESVGWVLSVLADDQDSSEQVGLIKRYLLNRVTETADAAYFVTNYKDGEYVLLSSERRADGVILEAILKADPKNDLIPKIVHGLLAGKTKGRWKNTQENAFVLLALDKYFQTFEKVTPNFVVKVWLGQNFSGEQTFIGRTADSKLINLPMRSLQKSNEAQNLVLEKQGDGRLYYRIGLKYAPKNLKAEAADFGFTVTRSYEAIDNPDDVKKDADGNWTIKAGARIRVNLQMVAPARRYHVALVDYLPAGLEIVNQKLAVSETLPGDDKKTQVAGDNYNYYRSIWYDHQNLRDERAEIFTALLREGVWNYSFLARAATPGNFIAPPAKAEEMYSPETFGRTKTDFVKIE